MKIVEVVEVVSHTVTIVSDEGTVEYVRYGPECWSRYYGPSLEEVYDCEELETLYQQHVRN